MITIKMQPKTFADIVIAPPENASLTGCVHSTTRRKLRTGIAGPRSNKRVPAVSKQIGSTAVMKNPIRAQQKPIISLLFGVTAKVNLNKQHPQSNVRAASRLLNNNN
jgi:hypothetical protein